MHGLCPLFLFRLCLAPKSFGKPVPEKNLAVFGRKNVTFRDIFALAAKVKQLSGLLSTISENGFVLRGMAVSKASKKKPVLPL